MTRKNSTHTRKPALFLMAWGTGDRCFHPGVRWKPSTAPPVAHPILCLPRTVGLIIKNTKKAGSNPRGDTQVVSPSLVSRYWAVLPSSPRKPGT